MTADSPEIDKLPKWSPDGKKIAFLSRRNGGGVFVADLELDELRMVSDSWSAIAWSPDGKRLVLVTYTAGANTIHTLDIDKGERTLVFETNDFGFFNGVSGPPTESGLQVRLGATQTMTYTLRVSLGKVFFLPPRIVT